MHAEPTFWVQVFEHRGDDILTGARIRTDDQASAIEKAADVGLLFGGAAVIRITPRPYSAEPTIDVLESYGRIPTTFHEGLAAGQASRAGSAGRLPDRPVLAPAIDKQMAPARPNKLGSVSGLLRGMLRR